MQQTHTTDAGSSNSAGHDTSDVLLRVSGLQTQFHLRHGTVRAVENASFEVRRGRALAIVGESGCGKTMTAYSILQLIRKPGKIMGGVIDWYPGRAGDRATTTDLLSLDADSRELRRIRGNSIAMVFQEPMNSLSPVHTIGSQIVEVLRLHRGMDRAAAQSEAVSLLGQIGIPNPRQRVNSYTFELSGGMRQRAMIAMALACDPELLIADEPTTALDVTTQAQILDLIVRLRVERSMALILITHDLGVVAENCDDVVVMYLGEVVEEAPVHELFDRPEHPYTAALLASTPVLGRGRRQDLRPIRGSVPDPLSRPSGCPFHNRCDRAIHGLCEHHSPPERPRSGSGILRCWHAVVPADRPDAQTEEVVDA